MTQGDPLISTHPAKGQIRPGRHDGKVAVITGAAQGIGLACAQKLFAEGASVVLSDRQEAEAARQAALLDPSGEHALSLACDVGSKADIARLMAEVDSRFGRLDILVNNAAISVPTEILDITEDELDSVLNVNLKGTFWCSQEAARIMVRQGAGAIVNLSSMQAELAIPNRVPYGISKAAINQITRLFALALATKGVRANAVGPGTILTPLTAGLGANEQAYRQILSRTPMGRVGQAEEVAAVVSFLASDDASYVTGQVLYPDGGRAHLNYTVPVPAPLPEL
ncbi:SDR family NAD(P)-dependent oxidoreductase [Rhodovibrionaceae bacterium A322]